MEIPKQIDIHVRFLKKAVTMSFSFDLIGAMISEDPEDKTRSRLRYDNERIMEFIWNLFTMQLTHCDKT